jgi:hypothetical protein
VEKGTYTRRRVDFSKYSVAFFNPYLFADAKKASCGCGAVALSTLTGILPERLALRNGDRHYSDRFMQKVLREQGFTVVPLSLCTVSIAKARLANNNVLLLSQLFRRNEATWGVVFNSMYYHNYQAYNLEVLSFLNKPVLTAYALWHPKWLVFPFPSKRQTEVKKSIVRARPTKSLLGGSLNRAL